MELGRAFSQRSVDNLLAGLGAPAGTTLRRKALPGGLHTSAYLITLEPQCRGIPPLVLRLYPGRHEDQALCATEAVALRALMGTTVPTPRLLWNDLSGAVFGVPAIATEYVPGAPPNALTAQAYAEIAGTLAALHRKTPPGELARTLPVRPSGLRGGLQQRMHDEWPRLISEPEVFLHGDVCAANTRFRDGRLVALIDWSNARPGPPSLDVAAMLLDADLFGEPGAGEASLLAYRRADGPTLPGLEGALAAYALFAARRLPAWAASLRELGVPAEDAIVESRYVDLCKRLESGIACEPRT